MPLYRCAACGSPNVVTDTQTGGVNYNFVKGAVGTVALGLGGAAAGMENQQQLVFKCPDCGITLTYAMPQEVKALIDAGVRSADARNHLYFSMNGNSMPVDWGILKGQFKNIEHGNADMQLEEKETQKHISLISMATASREEFDNAVDYVNDFSVRTGYNKSEYLLTRQQNIRNQLCTFEQICSIIRAWILLRKLTTEKLPLKPFMKRGKSLYACGNPKKR